MRARFGSEAAYLERYTEAVDSLIEREAVRPIDRDLLLATAPPYPAG